MNTNRQRYIHETRTLPAQQDHRDGTSPAPRRLIDQVAELVDRRRRRARLRRDLQRLDERLARDIGVDRYELAREAAKPCWRK